MAQYMNLKLRLNVLIKVAWNKLSLFFPKNIQTNFRAHFSLPTSPIIHGLLSPVL